jgi:hypothetical protein
VLTLFLGTLFHFQPFYDILGKSKAQVWLKLFRTWGILGYLIYQAVEFWGVAYQYQNDINPVDPDNLADGLLYYSYFGYHILLSTMNLISIYYGVKFVLQSLRGILEKSEAELSIQSRKEDRNLFIQTVIRVFLNLCTILTYAVFRLNIIPWWQFQTVLVHESVYTALLTSYCITTTYIMESTSACLTRNMIRLVTDPNTSIDAFENVELTKGSYAGTAQTLSFPRTTVHLSNS